MAVLCVIVVIPWHNALLVPDYWYEFMIQMMFTMLPTWAGTVILQSGFWGNFKSLQTWPSYIFLWCFMIVMYAILTCSYYILWTQHYDYYTPMPFAGYACGLSSGICAYIVLYWRYCIRAKKKATLD